MDLSIRRLEKRYPDFHIRLDLRVEDGEMLCLLGPSGCGKTTTLRLIAGFIEADAGEILLGGRAVHGLPPEKRRIGMVFQEYALFPHMNVRRNVAFGLEMLGASRRERDRKVRELLDLVRLAGWERRTVTSLSGGERQRVALARALAPGPRLLLLDEPLSALDARLRKDLRTEIRRIQRNLGVTTIYVTHDQEEALVLADRVAVMNAGRIEQIGAPRRLYRRPATRFVAGFVGEANLLPGRVESRRSGWADVATAVATFRIPAENVQSGDAADGLLFFRPESCGIESAAGAGSSTGAVGRAADAAGVDPIPAVVKRVEYLGDCALLSMGAKGDKLLKVKSTGPQTFEPGDRVRVHVDPESCLLLP